MFLICNQAAATLSTEIAAQLQFKLVISSMNVHSNNELELFIENNIPSSKCILILGFSNNSNQTIVELLLHLSELKSRGIKSIYLILPYLVYGRQCRHKGNKDNIIHLGPAVKMLNNIVNQDLIEKLIIIDMHNTNIFELNKNLQEIQHFELFRSIIPNQAIIVSPDKGSERRLLPYIAHGFQTATLEKTRVNNHKIIISGRREEFYRKDCIIIDDIVDSANTVCSAAKFLKECGANKITAFISHNLLSSKSVSRINSSDIDLMIITNTNSIKSYILECKKIKIISICNILANYLCTIN